MRRNVLVSGDTLQLKDYSKTDWEWSFFDPEHKKERHETVFPQECKKAYEMGKSPFGVSREVNSDDR
jgi:hypothetical protein